MVNLFQGKTVEATAKQGDFNFSGLEAPAKANDVYGLRYAEFVVPLVKGMQEQQQQIEALQIKNLSLQIENDSQNNILANQQLQLDAIKLLIKNK